MSDNNEIQMVETASGEWVSSSGHISQNDAFSDSPSDPSGKPGLTGFERANINSAWFIAWVWGIIPITGVVLQRLFR